MEPEQANVDNVEDQEETLPKDEPESKGEPRSESEQAIVENAIPSEEILPKKEPGQPASKGGEDQNITYNDQEKGFSKQDKDKSLVTRSRMSIIRWCLLVIGILVVIAVIAVALLFAFSYPRNLQPYIAGPKVDSNFADPCLIEVDNKYYAFATNKFVNAHADQVNIQIATSDDFNSWNLTGKDALPDVGAWGVGDHTWAPDVVRLDDGTFVMYYSTRHFSAIRHQCIGAATSKTIEGPYTPQATPIICPLSQGGAIDPDGFRDSDGKRYIVYKVDGNSMNGVTHSQNPTPVMLQEVDPKDGFTMIGSPTQMIDRIASDGPLVEAPSLLQAESKGSKTPVFVLFFSSGDFTTRYYDVKYATSTTGIKGPYIRASQTLLQTGVKEGKKLFGPGGFDVAADGTRVVFHSGTSGTSVTRQLWTGALKVNGTEIII